jgi:hypothetical protein
MNDLLCVRPKLYRCAPMHSGPTYHIEAGKPKMLCEVILLPHNIGCIIAVYLKIIGFIENL